MWKCESSYKDSYSLIGVIDFDDPTSKTGKLKLSIMIYWEVMLTWLQIKKILVFIFEVFLCLKILGLLKINFYSSNSKRTGLWKDEENRVV